MTASGFGRILPILLSIALAGCVGFILPRDVLQARSNIGESPPDFIVIGKTTRADVLLTLGEPDGTAEREGQLVYTAIRGKGGVFLTDVIRTYVDVEKRTYRGLLITFDDAGTVSEARIELKSCLTSDRDPPCVDVTGEDLLCADAEPQSRVAEDLAQGQVIAPVFWAKSGPFAVSNGRIVVGASNLFLFRAKAGGDETPAVAVAYRQVTKVSVSNCFLGSNSVTIERAGGTSVTLFVGNFFVTDCKATQQAGQLIEARWKAAVATVP